MWKLLLVILLLRIQNQGRNMLCQRKHSLLPNLLLEQKGLPTLKGKLQKGWRLKLKKRSRNSHPSSLQKKLSRKGSLTNFRRGSSSYLTKAEDMMRAI